MTSLVRFLYLATVATIAILPASGFNLVKVVVLVVFFIALAMRVALTGRTSLPSSLVVLPFAGVLVFSLLVAALKGSWESSVTDRAAASYGAVFAVSFSSYLVYKWRVVTLENFLVSLVVFHGMYLMVKLAVLFLPAAGAIGAGPFVALVQSYVPSAVIQEFSAQSVLGRLSLGNDILTPFLCGFVVVGAQLGVRIPSVVRSGFLALAAVSVLLTFTRYIWLAFLVIMLLAVVLFGRARVLGALVFALAAFALVAARSDAVRQAVVATATTRTLDVSSVDEKVEQAHRLFDELGHNVLVGEGVGAYLTDYIRDERLLFQYEVQWLGLGLQFGLLGLLVLLAYMGAIATNFIRAGGSWRVTRVGVYALSLYVLWLTSGVTNPYLSILASSLVYSLFIMVGLHCSDTAMTRPHHPQEPT